MVEPGKELAFGNEARAKMRAGVNKLANAVRETMGPRGRNVIYERNYGQPLITKDGVTVAKEVVLTDPFENMGAQVIREVAAKTGDEAGDGPQPLYSKILTPTGFTTMGDLEVGDEICGTDRTWQRVEGVYPKGEKEILKVHISGGKVVECCEDHLWGITTDYGKQKVLTVKEMESQGLFRENAKGDIRYRFYTPRTVSAFRSAKVAIDPYLLGVLIGDGSLSSLTPGAGSIELSLGFKKEYILGKLQLPEGFSLSVARVESKNYFRVKISGRGTGGETFHSLLKGLGLLGSKSATKFIPQQYLYNDEKTRRQLLQGLLDTDGYINERGRFEFSTISHALKVDFVDLCYSLGIPLHIKVHDRTLDSGSYSDRPIYRITELKGDKYGDKILRIEHTGIMTEMRCIKVSNPDNLYITDGFTVTHNTTSATVLAQAILEEGERHIAAGCSPVELKRGMDRALVQVKGMLRSLAKPVETSQDIANVASISANNEPELGKLIADAIDAVGRDGVISIAESGGPDTTLDMEDGFQIQSQLISRYFLPPMSTSVVFEDCYILVVDQDLAAVDELIPVMQAVHKSNRPVLMIANSLVGPALQTMVVNTQKGQIKAAVIQSPSFGDNRESVLEDIAVATGGVVFGSKAHCTPLREAVLPAAGVPGNVGKARRVTVTKSSTTIIEGAGSEEDITERIDALSAQLKVTASEFDKEKIQARIGSLSGGVAVINVGGNSEVEVKEIKDRVEDALHATRAAISGGIVPGGGTALVWASEALRHATPDPEISYDQQMGMKLVFKVCEAPLRQIVFNAGGSPDVVFDRVRQCQVGYNAHTGHFEDLMLSGVIDPVNVTISALTNAVSVAGTLLTTSCAIVIERKENPFLDANIPQL